MDDRKKIGDEGEDAAWRHLEGLGHTLFARNWRAGRLELDIVTLAADGIHFVEVKTRRPPVQLDPQDCVTLPKQRKMARAASFFLHREKLPGLHDAECHFDIVAVTIEDGRQRIEYFPDAFYPMFV